MNSLQARLFTWIGLCLLAMFVASGFLLYVYVHRELELHFDSVLLERANILARTTEQLADGNLEFEFLQAGLLQYQSPKNAEYYQVWQRTGQTVGRSSSLETRDLPVTLPLRQLPLFMNIELPDGRAGRLVAISFIPHEEEVRPTGTYIMALAISREELDNTLSRVFQGVCLAGLALVLGAFPGIWLSVRRALESLDLLGRQTSSIEADHLSFRFPVEDVPLELRPISFRLNNLLERLQAAFERERRFTADAAHELRTPIAELKTLAEVGLEEAAAETPSMRPYFEDALAVARHMESLVSLLLTLSRCEAGLQKIDLTLVDLKQVIREVWGSYERDVRDHNVSADIDLADGLIETDEGLLRAILANIFSNTTAYTPPGGKIQITLDSQGDKATLDVTNSNQDLSVSDVAHLFEAFWRKNQERSNTAHCGLGLSLVAAYARILNIKINASIPTKGFLRISLSFPGRRQDSIR